MRTDENTLIRHSVIFDMDGTLIDPLLGISNSYDHMCLSLGIPSISEDEVRRLIGPPIQVALSEFFGFDQPTLERAVKLFRSHYSSQGILEYRKYPGIDELLLGLHQYGLGLHIVTNKPVVFANRIVQDAGWDSLFSSVNGSSLDNPQSSKKDMISSVIKILSPDGSVIAYIGDRPEDASGSHFNGLPFVGVSWGFSTKEELIEAGALAVAGSMQQLGIAIRNLQAI